MLFQILTTTFPRRIGDSDDTYIYIYIYIYSFFLFFSGHMLLPNVLQMYHEPGLCCRGGVPWKNIANPVMINHLPQFALPCVELGFENIGISNILHTLHLQECQFHVNISSTFNCEKIICSIIGQNVCSWKSTSCAFPLSSPYSQTQPCSCLSKCQISPEHESR